MIPRSADIIIIGAGVVGSSIAYHLTQLGAKDIILLEKESLPATGSTAKANGGIRAQFATEINILLSLKSMEILDSLNEEMREQAGYIKAGYLFMASKKENWKTLQDLFEIQTKLGVSVQKLSRSEIEEKVLYAFSKDILGGTFGQNDGFIDSNGLATAFLKAAMKKGARLFLETEVEGFQISGKNVIAVKTSKGDIKLKVVINAAGPYAAQVALMAGIKLPVEPIRRHVGLTGRADFLPQRIPMTIDYDTGLVIRKEGPAVAICCADPSEKRGFDITVDRKYFEFISDKILKRFPILETAGMDTKKSWAGLYAQTPDCHAILGKVEEVHGFYLANGFSGHGLMHSPAVGLVLSELIVKGKEESLDISCLNLKRFKKGKLLHEKTVL